jgi:hypothetical protein
MCVKTTESILYVKHDVLGVLHPEPLSSFGQSGRHQQQWIIENLHVVNIKICPLYVPGVPETAVETSSQAVGVWRNW